MTDQLTAGQVRAALAEVHDDAPVMLVLGDTAAGWAVRVRYSRGCVDLLGGPTAHDRDADDPRDRTIAETER